jgi:hypothetical protein
MHKPIEMRELVEFFQFARVYEPELYQFASYPLLSCTTTEVNLFKPVKVRLTILMGLGDETRVQERVSYPKRCGDIM